MSEKHLIISVTNDLSTDQRVNKVAKTLQENGYSVLLIGRKLVDSPVFEASYPFKRFSLLFNKGPLFYAEYNLRLFFFLLFKKADILLSNDTDTLLANFLASRIKRTKLVFDAHELFPEVPEVVNRKWVKKFWTKLEDFILPRLKYGYTVCNSIAAYYKNRYGIGMEVIRNVPYKKDLHAASTEKALSFGDKKIILYQGAVNMGRGLEWMIDAMPLIDNAVLVIIGDGDVKTTLEKKVKQKKLSEKVIFIGRVAKEKLKEYTTCADIGLCLLANKGLSYYYSLPNRIFDFMQSGVPVLATNFPEIAHIVTTYQSGKLIEEYKPEYLARIVSEMLNDTTDQKREKIKINGKNFVWENEEIKLLAIFDAVK